jgi:hypothetical protein
MTNLIRRLNEVHALLVSANRQYHAHSVLAAIERIENDAQNLRRAKQRIAKLQEALDAESKTRDLLEAKLAESAK